eukprot:1409324-Rhodomonas_salina.1
MKSDFASTPVCDDLGRGRDDGSSGVQVEDALVSSLNRVEVGLNSQSPPSWPLQPEPILNPPNSHRKDPTATREWPARAGPPAPVLTRTQLPVVEPWDM